MGSKSSKIATSPKPRVEGEDGADGAGSNKNHRGETSMNPSKTDPKSSKRKRKVTLDPQVYRGKDVLAVLKAEETLRNSSLDIKSKLTQSMKSLRSDASASDASWYTDNSSVELIDHEAFQYPFENVIFEGGGNKGLAYAGAIRVSQHLLIFSWNNF